MHAKCRVFVIVKILIISGLFSLLAAPQVGAVSGGGVVSQVNLVRDQNGVGPLGYSPTLSYAAQLRADDMISNNYWSHTSPSGLGMRYFISAAGYPTYVAGENLSRGYSSDAAVVNAWLASASHSSTMLGAQYAEIGVGIATGTINGEPTVITVAYFAASGPVHNVLAPPAPPTPPAQPPQALPNGPTVPPVVSESKKVDNAPSLPKMEAETVELSSYEKSGVEISPGESEADKVAYENITIDGEDCTEYMNLSSSEDQNRKMFNSSLLLRYDPILMSMRFQFA